MNKIYIILVITFFISCNHSNKAYHKLTDGSKESCVACHDNLSGFSKYHNPNDIGCSACHIGNTNATDKDIAHQNMVKVPGNLTNASKTCSTSRCHQNELNRVNKSIMSTNSGIVSIDRWAFEEIHTTDTLFHIENIRGSAADRHLKNLCFKCHLGYEKKHYAATNERSRGGGCLACHLNYAENTKPNINDAIHPTLNLNISNDKCFGCHSRSNRISTNYEGWYETLYTQKEVSDSTGFRILQDGRVFGYAGDDIHHKAGLLCIDCHSSQEIMGDGKDYKHENQAVKIQCIDCHTKSKLKTVGYENFGTIEALDYALRDYQNSSDRFIITIKDSIPLVNTYFDENNQAFLISKINQKMHVLTRSCEQDNTHNNLTCNMCHTSWAPSCIGCHTTFNSEILLSNGKKGKWVEELGGFSYAQPVMAVNHSGDKKLISPAIPGMIMTLDKSNFTGVHQGSDSIFLRLFAPIAAHTTTNQTRSCASCHTNPQALGYGKGKLTYIVNVNTAYWQFESLYENSIYDSLPQDAWNGFLSKLNYSKKYSAHEEFYPLNAVEQKKVLRVGACLYCHKEDEVLQQRLIREDFKYLLKIRSKKCILPF